MALSPRERVLAALDHEEPDRVPLALWGSWYGITDRLYFGMLETLGWDPVPPFRPARLHSVNYYDDRLLELLAVDVRHVDPGAVAACSGSDADAADAFGVRWITRGPYRSPAGHPLREATVESVARHPFPRGNELIDADAVRARLARIRAMGREYAVVGRAVASYGVFEMAQALRGPEQLLMDLVLDPELVHALVDRLSACHADMIERFLDVADDGLDLLELPGDDFAGNTGLIISPSMFDQYFKEPYRRLIARIKARCPQLRVVFHSDGVIADLLPRFIEIGVDVVHSVEPLPAWNLAEMKARYGSRLAFMGGIDIRTALQGGRDRVASEVRTRLAELAPDGGYVLAPANHLQWDIPPQNVFALYEVAGALGTYPLGR